MANFNFEYMGDYLQYKDSQGNTLIVNGGIINETATGAVAEITDGAENIPVKSLTVTLEPIQSGTGDPSPENVRPISGRTKVNVWREATYDTSAELALTIQLGRTVYGGTVDVTTGEMVVDMAYYAITNDTELALDSSYTDFNRVNIVDGTGRLSGKPSGAIISNLFKPGTLVVNGVFMHGTTGTINFTPSISIGTTIPEIKAWLIANNATFCYELAEPVTITLTPEQLTTLLGTNYIWSDADSVSVDYVADTKLYIQKAISDSI